MLQKINTPITLPRDAEVVDDAPSFVQSGGNYMFYDRRTTFRKPNAYEKLIASANRSIWVWDPYLDSDNFPRLFAKVEAKTIRIEILTTLALHKSKDDLQTITTNIRDEVLDTCTSCDVVGIAYYKQDWHDRYLIIDEQKVYLVGASMDAHRDSNKSYGIYEVTEPKDIGFIIQKYTDYRDNYVKYNSKEKDTASKP